MRDFLKAKALQAAENDEGSLVACLVVGFYLRILSLNYNVNSTPVVFVFLFVFLFEWYLVSQMMSRGCFQYLFFFLCVVLLAL